MDAPTTFAILFLVLSKCYLSNQLVPHAVTPVTDNRTNDATVEADNATAACTNSRGAAGGCVERFNCNYNTTHIDLTVYGPPGYRDPCQGKGVCCPTEYILVVAPAKTSGDDKFDFGDDD